MLFTMKRMKAMKLKPKGKATLSCLFSMNFLSFMVMAVVSIGVLAFEPEYNAKAGLRPDQIMPLRPLRLFGLSN